MRPPPFAACRRSCVRLRVRAAGRARHRRAGAGGASRAGRGRSHAGPRRRALAACRGRDGQHRRHGDHRRAEQRAIALLGQRAGGAQARFRVPHRGLCVHRRQRRHRARRVPAGARRLPHGHRAGRPGQPRHLPGADHAGDDRHPRHALPAADLRRAANAATTTRATPAAAGLYGGVFEGRIAVTARGITDEYGEREYFFVPDDEAPRRLLAPPLFLADQLSGRPLGERAPPIRPGFKAVPPDAIDPLLPLPAYVYSGDRRPQQRAVFAPAQYHCRRRIGPLHDRARLDADSGAAIGRDAAGR